MFKANNIGTRIRYGVCLKLSIKDNRAMSMTLPWCLYWQLWTCFTPCSSISVIELGYAFVVDLGHAFRYASLNEYNPV